MAALIRMVTVFADGAETALDAKAITGQCRWRRLGDVCDDDDDGDGVLDIMINAQHPFRSRGR